MPTQASTATVSHVTPTCPPDYMIECSGEDPQFEDTKEAALAVAEVLLAEDRATAAIDGEWPDSAETIRVYRRELVAESKTCDVEGGVDFSLTELAAATVTDAGLLSLERAAKLAEADGDEWDMDDIPDASLALAAMANPYAILRLIARLRKAEACIADLSKAQTC